MLFTIHENDGLAKPCQLSYNLPKVLIYQFGRSLRCSSSGPGNPLILVNFTQGARSPV